MNPSSFLENSSNCGWFSHPKTAIFSPWFSCCSWYVPSYHRFIPIRGNSSINHENNYKVRHPGDVCSFITILAIVILYKPYSTMLEVNLAVINQLRIPWNLLFFLVFRIPIDPTTVWEGTAKNPLVNTPHFLRIPKVRLDPYKVVPQFVNAKLVQISPISINI